MTSPAAELAPEVVLVGAGLVGSLLGTFLARRGHRVRVLERRPDMRRESISAGRSINLAISARGLHALRQVGLEEEALRHAVAMRGRMVHSPSGELAFVAYGKDDSQCIHSLSRAWLNKALMSHAEATGRVRIEFRRRVVDADVSAETLQVRDEESGEMGVLRAPVVIGTDGSASAIRAALAARHGAQVTESALTHGYKELTIPPGEGGRFLLEKHALHIWPRGSYMLIALPNEDASFTCTLFLPFEGPVSFASLRTPAEVRGLFEREFPDALALLPTLERDFFEHPTGQMVTVRCSPWHLGGKALLVGDAAHAIVPFFGQGMNCGFEDCVRLDALLGEGRDWGEAFEAFFRARKTHADAIADMAIENFVEMRDKVADPAFQLQKQVERKLLNAFPGEFLSRYTLVSFSLAPYRLAYRIGEVAGEIVRELSEPLTSPDQLDLTRAAALVRERLAPLVKENARELEA